MDKKYEVMNDCTIQHNDITLHKIRAIKNFGKVKTGALGGWIESEDNLSHEGNCWVADNAKVFGPAKITENAIISDNATVYGESNIYGNVRISDYARIINAKIYENAHVQGNAQIEGCRAKNSDISLCVRGYTRIKGYVLVRGTDIIIKEDASLADRVRVDNTIHNKPIEVSGEADISGISVITGGIITGRASLYNVNTWDTPVIKGDVYLKNGRIKGNAYVAGKGYELDLCGAWIGPDAYVINNLSTVLFVTPREKCTAYLCKDKTLRLISSDSLHIFDYDSISNYVAEKYQGFLEYAAYWNAADMIIGSGNQQVHISKEE